MISEFFLRKDRGVMESIRKVHHALFVHLIIWASLFLFILFVLVLWWLSIRGWGSLSFCLVHFQHGGLVRNIVTLQLQHQLEHEVRNCRYSDCILIRIWSAVSNFNYLSKFCKKCVFIFFFFQVWQIVTDQLFVSQQWCWTQTVEGAKSHKMLMTT